MFAKTDFQRKHFTLVFYISLDNVAKLEHLELASEVGSSLARLKG